MMLTRSIYPPCYVVWCLCMSAVSTAYHFSCDIEHTISKRSWARDCAYYTAQSQRTTHSIVLITVVHTFQ
jgi:hypothetical protein